MGATIERTGNIDCEYCDIATYRTELAESGDQGFAEHLSRRLVGMQTSIHLCYSTWGAMLRKAGITDCNPEMDCIEPQRLADGLNTIDPFELLDRETHILPILKHIARDGIENHSSIVWC